ncbi:MAG: hypothetical protein ACREC3_00715 [Methyloceanibacter sp.]
MFERARALESVFEAAFFDEDLVIRVVGDTIVLAAALIANAARLGFPALGCYQVGLTSCQIAVALQGSVAA